MKRVLSIFVLLFITIFVVSCGTSSTSVSNAEKNTSYGDVSISNNSQEEKPTNEVTQEKEDSNDDQIPIEILSTVIYDEEGIKVTAQKLDFNGFMGPEIKMLVENNTDKNITVQARDVAANGYMISTSMSIDVAAGKKATDGLTMMEDSLLESGITCLTDVQFKLHIFESDTYDSIVDSEEIKLNTTIVDIYQQEYDDSGNVLYEGNNLKVVNKGVYIDEIFGPEVKLYLENNSDQPICVQIRDVSVNDFMVNSSFSCDILPGLKAIDDITFFSNDLEENGITQIDTIELIFHVFNTETHDTVFDSEVLKWDIIYD